MRTVERNRRPSAFDDARLVPPQMREGVVQRADLVHRLRAGGRSTVALIVAPAGYGKTTTLAQVARLRNDRPFVWLCADEADNQPLAFARFVTAGLERSGAIDVGPLRTRARATDSHAVLIARLMKAMKSARPLTIAIDDLHLVTSLRSLKIVEAIANNLSPRSQLLLASRTRPRLGLTAVRAAGRLIELGTDDLRLSNDESLQLLHATGVDASPADAADLTARAQGWSAGIYLAALACEGDGRRLSVFDGSDRFVSDYFEAEYLDRLDAGDLTFLLRASVLEHLSGPLCDAVLRTPGSAARLDRIARSNLFVTSLGSGTSRVFQLHPMLREALAAELRRREPARVERIARRAADWSERHGDIDEAVEYAWAAGERDRFVDLVEHAALQLFQVGHLTTIEDWLGRLDTDMLEAHPALAVCGAFVHALRGRPGEADTWTAIAERAPLDTAMPDGTPSPEPWIAVLRASMFRGGKDEMRQDAARALAGLAEGSPWRPSALMLLGIGQLLAGEGSAADEILAEAHVAATRAVSANTAAVAVAARSLLAAGDERWDAAENLAASAREILTDARLDDCPTSPITFVADARSAVHRSDWVRARNDLAHAREHLPERAPAWFVVLVQLEAARAHLGLSERDQASASLARAEKIIGRAPDLGVLLTHATELRAELSRTARPARGGEELTPAELRLLPLLTTHLTFREIGELLGISRNTVKTQAICTYRKFGVGSRSDAIERAIELGLVEKSDALAVAADTR